jgi:tripartite-type tricarboxylate transporter receptor subunit TctC
MKRPVATRRAVLAAALGAALPGVPEAQVSNNASEVFPSRAVRLVLPSPPGTAPDIRGRHIAQKLSEEWQQAVVVDNRPGANGRVSWDFVLQAPPDGHTMLLGGFALATAPHLTKLPYDPLKEFAAVSKISAAPLILLAHPGSPFDSVSELVAHGRANPGNLNAASFGVGSITHLAIALLSKSVGLEFTHVPYNGGGTQMIADLIGGQVQLLFDLAVVALPHLKSGRIKALAVTSESRLAVLPSVPTFNELGYPAMGVAGWQGVFVRANTSPDIIARLNRTLVRVLNLPDIRQAIVDTGAVVGGDSPEEFAAFVRGEHAKWGRIIADAAIRLE